MNNLFFLSIYDTPQPSKKQRYPTGNMQVVAGRPAQHVVYTDFAVAGPPRSAR